MKKLLTTLFAIVLAISSTLLFACTPATTSESLESSASSESLESQESVEIPANLTFYAPDGAPALSIAKFIKDNENFGMNANISYNVVSASNIGPTMMQGKGDFIVMPVNAASKLYKANASDPYVMTAVVTHGNLYIVSNEELTLEGLKGKVIGVIGRGLVPDLTFKAILQANGLLDSVVEGSTPTDGKITIRYFAEAPEMLPLLKQGMLTVGLLPEPAATKLTTKLASDKTWFRLDAQELYDSETKAYPQAVLMVKKSVYDKYKANIDQMAAAFADNLTWVKANTAEAITAINGVLPEGAVPSLDATSITSTVIDNCKIYYQSAVDAKQEVKDYINKIIAVDNSSAKAISDDFFA